MYAVADKLVAAGEGDGGGGGGGDNIMDQTRARKIKRAICGWPDPLYPAKKCTYLGIGTSSPNKEICLNPKYHLGGKFTARLSN